MIQQTLIDTLADDLVEKGVLVSYSTVQEALREHNRQPDEDAGKGASYRDLHTLLTNWRDRRRYKGHLAALKMPERMEKALAVFAARAMKAAEDRIAASKELGAAAPDTLAVMAQMERFVARLEEQMAALAAENRSLRKEIAALRPSSLLVAEGMASRPPRPKGGGRKKGVSAATSRFFWDRVVQELCVELKRRGTMTLVDMFDAIDLDTKVLAAHAFQAIDIEKLEEKLAYRVENAEHRLCRLADGTYSLINGPLPRRMAQAEADAR